MSLPERIEAAINQAELLARNLVENDRLAALNGLLQSDIEDAAKLVLSHAKHDRDRLQRLAMMGTAYRGEWHSEIYRMADRYNVAWVKISYE